MSVRAGTGNKKDIRGRRPGRKRTKPDKPHVPVGQEPKWGGPRPGSGRPRGSSKGGRPRGLYKVVENQEELAVMCRKHALPLFEELYWLATKSKDENTRLSAIREIFDRGFGRPKQIQVWSGAMTITHEQAIREINRQLEQPFPEDIVSIEDQEQGAVEAIEALIEAGQDNGDIVPQGENE